MPQAGASAHSGLPPPPLVEANTDNFLVRRVEPQWGHGVPVQSELLTSTSLSRRQLLQLNS